MGRAVDTAEEGGYPLRAIERKSEFGFSKCKPVFLLDDPDGSTWVMKAFTREVDPTITYE